MLAEGIAEADYPMKVPDGDTSHTLQKPLCLQNTKISYKFWSDLPEVIDL